MAAEEFVVRDGRSGYGVVFLSHMDTDEFRKLSTGSRCVYFALLPYAGRETQKCWPKISSLAKVVGFSERTIYRAIKELADAKYIHVGKKEFSKTRRVNLYTILEPPK